MKQLDLTGLEWKMNSELSELMTYVCTKLDEAGLEDITPSYIKDTNHRYAVTGRFLNANGDTLDVKVVNRFNGAKENISIRVEYMTWSNHSCHAVESVKFSYKDSKKKVDRLVNQITELYLNGKR